MWPSSTGASALPRDDSRDPGKRGTCGAALSPTVAARLMDALRESSSRRDAAHSVADLTAREREVLALLSRGLSNAEIAAELFLVEGAVKGNISGIFTRLGVPNRVEAAVPAYQASIA